MNFEVLAIVIGLYALVIGYLGWLGHQKTKSAAVFLSAGLINRYFGPAVKTATIPKG